MVFIAILLSTMAVIYVAASVFLPKEPEAKTDAKPPETVPASAIMSREEALAVLGLTPAASKGDVKTAYIDIMKKVHPDHHGGTDWIAAKVNLARTVLLDRRP